MCALVGADLISQAVPPSGGKGTEDDQASAFSQPSRSECKAASQGAAANQYDYLLDVEVLQFEPDDGQSAEAQALHTFQSSCDITPLDGAEIHGAPLAGYGDEACFAYQAPTTASGLEAKLSERLHGDVLTVDYNQTIGYGSTAPPSYPAQASLQTLVENIAKHVGSQLS